jgi:hypothetical protein
MSNAKFQGAIGRVAKFVDERGEMRGLDPDEIAGLHTGDEVRAACLNLSDLRLLLRELGKLQDAAKQAGDAYRQRFGNDSGGLFGPIDREMVQLEEAAKRAAH